MHLKNSYQMFLHIYLCTHTNVCVSVCVRVHATAHGWKLEENLWQLSLILCHVDPKDLRS